jgi:hypothetical protein
MSRLVAKVCELFRCEESDRRPRILRRVMPTAYATSRPLNGTELAKLHVVAFH